MQFGSFPDPDRLLDLPGFPMSFSFQNLGINSRLWLNYRPNERFQLQLTIHNIVIGEKRSCRREAARCFVALNMLLSHSRSFEMTPLSRACMRKSLLVFHCKWHDKLCLYLVLFLRHSTSNNGVTLNSELGVIQDNWKLYH